MAKINRQNANIVPFGINAPSGDRKVFNEKTESDEITDNITPSFLIGAGALDLKGGALNRQDVNAYLYAISLYSAILHQQGISQWASEQEYYEGSISKNSTGKLYLSLNGSELSPNIGNQLTNTDHWRELPFNIPNIPIANGDYILRVLNTVGSWEKSEQVSVIAYGTSITGTGLLKSTLSNGVYTPPNSKGRPYQGRAVINKGSTVPQYANNYQWEERPGKVRIRIDSLTTPVGSGTISLSPSIANFDSVYIEFYSDYGSPSTTKDYYFPADKLNRKTVVVAEDINVEVAAVIEFTVNNASIVIHHAIYDTHIKQVWGIR